MEKVDTVAREERGPKRNGETDFQQKTVADKKRERETRSKKGKVGEKEKGEKRRDPHHR